MEDITVCMNDECEYYVEDNPFHCEMRDPINVKHTYEEFVRWYKEFCKQLKEEEQEEQEGQEEDEKK